MYAKKALSNITLTTNLKVLFHFSNDPRSHSNQIFNTSFDINWSVNEAVKCVFENNNIAVSTIDCISPNEADFAFFFNIPFLWDRQAWRAIRQTANNNCLIIYEPIFVNPLNYMGLLHRFFSVILTIDADMARRGGRYSHIIAPQSMHGINSKEMCFHDKKFFVLINANKEVFLPFRIFTIRNRELYSERIKFLEFAESYPIEGFDLYGKGWNSPKKYSLTEKLFGYKKYRSYRGTVGDTKKIEVLSHYRFALCFENAVQRGSITEKIFDCFKARCVPVYLGAPDIAEYIPADCFIDFRKFASYNSMLSFLQSMSEDKYVKYIKAIEKFLDAETTMNYWFERGFADRLFKVFKENSDVRLMVSST